MTLTLIFLVLIKFPNSLMTNMYKLKIYSLFFTLKNLILLNVRLSSYDPPLPPPSKKESICKSIREPIQTLSLFPIKQSSLKGRLLWPHSYYNRCHSATDDMLKFAERGEGERSVKLTRR